MISSSDAHDFCAVAAQVIPTLLIALFVADRVIEPSIGEIGDNQAPAWQDVEAEMNSARIALQKDRVTLIDRLRESSSPSSEDFSTWLSLWESNDRSARKLDAVAAKLEVLSGRQNRARFLQARLYGGYVNYMFGVFVASLFGELGALAGIIHSPEYKLVTLVSGSSIILILAALAYHAWGRLFARGVFPSPDGANLRKIYNIGVFSFPAIGTVVTVMLACLVFK